MYSITNCRQIAECAQVERECKSRYRVAACWKSAYQYQHDVAIAKVCFMGRQTWWGWKAVLLKDFRGLGRDMCPYCGHELVRGFADAGEGSARRTGELAS